MEVDAFDVSLAGLKVSEEELLRGGAGWDNRLGRGRRGRWGSSNGGARGKQLCVEEVDVLLPGQLGWRGHRES